MKKKKLGGFSAFSLVVKVPADLLHLLIFGEGINIEIGLKILLTGFEYFLFPLSTPWKLK